MNKKLSKELRIKFGNVKMYSGSTFSNSIGWYRSFVDPSTGGIHCPSPEKGYEPGEYLQASKGL